MRRFYLLIVATILASCSASPVPTQPSSGYPTSDARPSGSVRPNSSGPSITKVSAIKPKQTQNIVITGRGFGAMQPYNGDSDYLQIWDTTAGWSAGLDSTSQDDTVTLNVTSWTSEKIVVSGFTGGYGENYWVLHKGDNLEINVWNAKTRKGPATIDTTVK